MNDRLPPQPPMSLSMTACWVVLAVAFLGWMCAGWQMAITSIAMHVAAKDLLGEVDKSIIDMWFGRLTAAFLLGAAFGGYLFGWLGDRLGRAKAMAASIVCYSIFSAAAVWARDPYQLFVLRFACCMGIGGMWPNGIALVSEVWPNISRPILAGAIGTSANFGIMMLSGIAKAKPVTADAWHWIMWLGATPIALGLAAWFFVPESPGWLAKRSLGSDGDDESKAGDGTNLTSRRARSAGLVEIFQPPILGITLLGILLGTIPLFGGWGCSNWAMGWASKVGEEIGDPSLKADLSLARSLPGTISSLIGGGVAMLIGRRRAYFAFCIGALVSALVLYVFLTPDGDRTWFIVWFASLGFFSGFFFGWLPLCLPELFPTRVRATGAGVSFNWGRILTAFGVLAASQLLQSFGGYAQVGRITSLIYLAGAAIVFFIPDTSGRSLQD